jgi:hypothetical protein
VYEIARHGGDVIDGRLMEAENEEDVFEGPAARLVEAVLQLGGASPALSAPSPLAAKIRDLIPVVQDAIIATTLTDARAIEELGISPEDFLEHVAACKRRDQLVDQFDALRCQAWAMPVRNFDDAVLLAEIAQHDALDFVAHGESDGLIDPPCYDQEAYGRLTMAVLSLAGRPFNARSTQSAETRHG